MRNTYIGLPAILARARAANHAVVTAGAAELQKRSAAAAPVDEGTLGAGIHVASITDTTTGTAAVVATGGESSDYAIPQHDGAGPHVIEAKNGKALNWPGAAHPVRRVNHPGNPPTKFMEEPLLAFTPEFHAKHAAMMRAVF